MLSIARTRQGAFTLLELAIVLIVLGLLAGGVLTGQSLIHAAEINSIAADYTRYTQASIAFREKYFARPGDMSNATQFWGFAGTTTPDCVSNSGITTISTPGTCDGNGNNIMDYGITPKASTEQFRAWQQLALAGLIEGSYTGNAGAVTGRDPDNGINTPVSKIASAGWGYGYYDNSLGLNPYSFNYDMRNWLVFGNEDDNDWPDGIAISSLDALNLDTKLDDGKPGTGSVLANGIYYGSCTNASGTSDRASVYTPRGNVAACALVFQPPN